MGIRAQCVVGGNGRTADGAGDGDGLEVNRAQIQYIAVERVEESKTNQRTKFDQGGLGELSNSIGEHGIRVPLLMRPHPEKRGWFEIIAGARRFRAAKMAGLKQVPAIVELMTDAEALEVQVIENLQREDLQPLEEADGFASMLASGKYTEESLAGKLGKPRGYIKSRVKLASLGKTGRKAVQDGDLNLTVALKIAKLPDVAAQQAATKWCTAKKGFAGLERPSTAESMRYIEENFMLDLKKAPFDTKDAALLANARGDLSHIGACTDCPHRTGNAADLFGDVKSGDVCTFAACFHAKVKAAEDDKLRAHKATGGEVLAPSVAKSAISEWDRGSWDVRGEEFITPQDYGYGLPGNHGKTLRERLGKDAPRPVLATLPKSGRVVELFRKAEVAKILQKKYPRSAMAPAAGGMSQSAAEKARLLKDRITRVVKYECALAAAEMMYRQKNGGEPPWFTSMAEVGLGVADNDFVKWLVKKCAIEIPKSKNDHRYVDLKKVFDKWLVSQPVMDWFRYGMAMVLEEASKAWHTAGFQVVNFAKERGVDVAAIRTQVTAELTPKKKEKAAKASKVEKPAETPVATETAPAKRGRKPKATPPQADPPEMDLEDPTEDMLANHDDGRI